MKPEPLVILGFDVGDAASIERWAQEGRLPTIASIMRRGCHGRIAGPEQECEHGAALSLYSGISRRQHGYYYFRQIQPGTYSLRKVSPHELGVSPFWSHLRNHGRKVAIIDAPETGLVDGLPGVQISNWAVHEALSPPSSMPPTLLQEINQKFGAAVAVDENYHADRAEELQIHQRLRQRIEKKGTVCRHLLAGDEFDLVSVTFYEAHTASHQFWKHGSGTNGPNELTHAIRDVYEAIDRQMGLILEQLPAHANVVILSLFGMQDQFPTTGLMEAFCQRLGYQVRQQSARRSFRPIDLARRLIPQRVRFALSQHLSADTQERLLADQLRQGTDWLKTTAFAIPSLYTGFIRVNLHGREPEGSVEPGKEYKALLDRIEADLMQLIDPPSGERAVQRVHRTVDVFGGGPPASLPDLFVEWRPWPYFQERVAHPRAELTQQRPTFCPGSEEKLQGFFAAAGPSIKARGTVGESPSLDLAPTWLALMQVPIPDTMHGKVSEVIAHGAAG